MAITRDPYKIYIHFVRKKTLKNTIFICSCNIVKKSHFCSYKYMFIFQWMVQYSSTLILGSTISVDSFFMVSGMLVSLGFFEYITKTGQFNLILFYVHRYLRITLPLSLVVLFYVTLPQFLGSGPMLYNVYRNHQKHCQDYWWSTLLHLQAYVNPDKLVSMHFSYISFNYESDNNSVATKIESLFLLFCQIPNSEPLLV